MDEAEVEPGRERMRACRRHAALRRHPRVAERVRPGEVGERELLDELVREARLLVDLDHAARAHDAEVGPVVPHPGLRIGRVGLDDEDRVARAHARLTGAAERVRERPADLFPALARARREERQLARPVGNGIAVDRDTCAVRPAVRHLLEHRGEVDAEPRPPRRPTSRTAPRSRTCVQKLHMAIRADTVFFGDLGRSRMELSSICL